jgi:1,4-alpha-glucan branching enzyme
MPVLAENIGHSTPMGATVVPGGATFRTWAPSAQDVYIVTDAHATASWSHWTPNQPDRLVALGDGTWAGFVPGIGDGDSYLFWVRGPAGGSEGFKHDPYARELGTHASYARPRDIPGMMPAGSRPPSTT